jgi:soluble lytic murein transglycosylase-like protein
MANYLDNLDEGQKRVVEMIREQAQAQGVPVNLALSLAFAENGFRQYDQNGKVILSPKGAVGIMQVMPGTGKEYGFSRQDLTDPERNIEAGVSVLKDFLSRSNGDSMMAAGMYNAGPNHSFFKTGKGDLPEETQNYIAKINGYGGFGEGEPTPNEPKQPVEVEPEPNEPTPEATIYTQEAADPAVEAQKNKEMAAATGAVLGAGYGFAESRLNRADTRAMREEMARERARAQYAQMESQRRSTLERREPQLRLPSGALPEAPATGGTSGEKWSRNWRGVETPGSRSVPESASMYQRGKVQGGSKVSQRINKLYPKLSPDDPNAIWERLSKQTDERAAAAAEQAMQQRMAEEQANQQRLIQVEEDTNRARAARLEAERPINRARAALTSVRETPLGQIGARVAETAFKRFPVVGYGAASASMGMNVAEIDEALQRQEYLDALIAASQLAATGASMYPPLAPIAVPAAFGLEAVKQARERYR